MYSSNDHVLHGTSFSVVYRSNDHLETPLNKINDLHGARAISMNIPNSLKYTDLINTPSFNLPNDMC